MPAMAVHAAHVRSSHAHHRVLDGRAGDVLRLLHRLLDRAHRFIQIDDDAFARAARFGHAVPAIAQAVVGDFRHQRASLGAAYINRGQKMLVLIPHAYREFLVLCNCRARFRWLAWHAQQLASSELRSGLCVADGAPVLADLLRVSLWPTSCGFAAAFAGALALPCTVVLGRAFLRSTGFGRLGCASRPGSFEHGCGDWFACCNPRNQRRRLHSRRHRCLGRAAESGGCFAVPCRSGFTMI